MFTSIMEMLGMNQLLNLFIITIPSLSELLRSLISRHKKIFQTWPLLPHQQTGHKSYPTIFYSVQVLFRSLSQISSTQQHWYHDSRNLKNQLNVPG